jgi:hypothetical protein
MQTLMKRRGWTTRNACLYSRPSRIDPYAEDSVPEWPACATPRTDVSRTRQDLTRERTDTPIHGYSLKRDSAARRQDTCESDPELIPPERRSARRRSRPFLLVPRLLGIVRVCYT